MPNPTVSVNLEWNKVPTDGTKCANCEELIIGNMFQMVAFVDYTPIESGTKICEECYSLIKTDEQ